MGDSGRGEGALVAREADRRTPSEALAEVERALLAELDSTRFLHLLVESASRLFGALTGVWLVADHDVLVERITSVPGTFPVGRMTFSEGMTGQCARERRGLVVRDYPRWPHAVPRYVAAGLRQAMAHPLLMGDQVLGVLTMSRTGDDAAAFTDEDFASLEHLAGLAALALRNATLYAEAERRRWAAEGLAHVARTLTGIQDIGLVASRIAESVLTLFPGCLGAGVAASEAEGPAEILAVGGPLSDIVPPGQPFVLGPLLDRVRREQRIVNIADLQSEPEPADPRIAARRREVWFQAGVRAVLGIPLVARGRTVGILGMGFGEPRAFDAQDVAMAQAFADQAALALENARLYREADRRRREVEVVAGIARTISATLDVDTILQRVADGARVLCRSDAARIALRDDETDAVIFRYWVNARYQGYGSIRVRPGTGALGGLALMTGRPVRTDDWMADPRFSKETAAVIEAEGIVTQMAVPIRIGDRMEGLLYVDNRTARPFTERDEAALVQLAEHAGIAIRKAQLYVAAQTTGARLQALSSRLLEVQETERRHLARELHDEVGQALTAVKINLQMLQHQGQPAASARRLDDSLDMVDRILQGVRQMSLDLRPSLLDDLGLAAALRWYVGAQAQRAGLIAEVVTDSLTDDLSTAAATTCYRVVQEAVTNVVRHARATRISVALARAEGGFELSIHDDGVGFDVTAARRRALQGTSMGLFGLEERVELAGGRSAIESAPGRGTTVRAWLPSSLAPAAWPQGEEGTAG